MHSPRIRRLLLDHQTLTARLAAWSLIQIKGTAGMPPEFTDLRITCAACTSPRAAKFWSAMSTFWKSIFRWVIRDVLRSAGCSHWYSIPISTTPWSALEISGPPPRGSTI